MAEIWVAAAWVIPVFAGAAGVLLFGYLRFFRWSQAEERRAEELWATSADASVGPLRPFGRGIGREAIEHVLAAGSKAA